MAKLPLSNNMRTSSWRSTSLTLLLGGTLGYLLAVLCLFGIHGTDRHDFLDSHFTGKRWLEEESFGNDSSEMNETGEAEVDAVSYWIRLERHSQCATFRGELLMSFFAF